MSMLIPVLIAFLIQTGIVSGCNIPALAAGAFEFSDGFRSRDDRGCALFPGGE